jgi:hypothetical protein
VSDELARASWFIKNLPRLLREAVEAGEEVIKAFRKEETRI